jgi:hypothetical protein
MSSRASLSARTRRRRSRTSSATPGAGDLADRPDRALETDVKILALSIEERTVILAQLDDPPDGLAELRGVLPTEHEWLRPEGLD